MIKKILMYSIPLLPFTQEANASMRAAPLLAPLASMVLGSYKSAIQSEPVTQRRQPVFAASASCPYISKTPKAPETETQLPNLTAEISTTALLAECDLLVSLGTFINYLLPKKTDAGDEPKG
jgi:hypothetical protein